jgi:hypothetical protein
MANIKSRAGKKKYSLTSFSKSRYPPLSQSYYQR